jgi:hypothetical protein
MELTIDEHKVIIDDEDYEKISKFKWYILITVDGNKYVSKTAKSDIKFIHHLVFGKPENGKCIDHINGNGLDNRKSNLRICTNQMNQGNQKIKKSNTSGYKGVGWVKDRKKWRAYICFGRKYKHLGSFESKEEAARKYDEYAKLVFGEFARTNFKAD